MLTQHDVDFFNFHAVHVSCAAKLALVFMGFSRGQVASARLTVPNFSLGGQPESLLRGFVGFHLGHGMSLSL
jgi:hypothetical protein